MVQWKHAALLALALAVVGCSSNSKKELPPAELTDFKEEVVLSKQWSRSVGDGQGDLYNLLEPAVDGSTIYAASAEGRVMAIQRETGDVLEEGPGTSGFRRCRRWLRPGAGGYPAR